MLNIVIATENGSIVNGIFITATYTYDYILDDSTEDQYLTIVGNFTVAGSENVFMGKCVINGNEMICNDEQVDDSFSYIFTR